MSTHVLHSSMLTTVSMVVESKPLEGECAHEFVLFELLNSIWQIENEARRAPHDLLRKTKIGLGFHN